MIAIRRDFYEGDLEEIFVVGQVTGHLFVRGDGVDAVGAVVVVEQQEPVALGELIADVDVVEDGKGFANPGFGFEDFVGGGGYRGFGGDGSSGVGGRAG